MIARLNDCELFKFWRNPRRQAQNGRNAVLTHAQMPVNNYRSSRPRVNGGGIPWQVGFKQSDTSHWRRDFRQRSAPAGYIYEIGHKKKSPCLQAGLLADRTGLEPATSGVTGRHSNQTELPIQTINTFPQKGNAKIHQNFNSAKKELLFGNI